MQNAPPFIIAKEFLVFQQTFCSSEAGTFKSTAFVLFRHKAYLLVIPCQSPHRFGLSLLGPFTRKTPSVSLLGASWAPPPPTGCQAIGQNAQKSRITADSLRRNPR